MRTFWGEQDKELAIELYDKGLAHRYIGFILKRTTEAVMTKLSKMGREKRREFSGRQPNLTGQVFGKLTVLRRDGYIRDKRAWLCKCDCGNTTRLATSIIKGSRVRSCGCLNKFKTGVAAFNRLFGQYKAHARQRNLDFCLTEEYFKELTQGNCFYCNSSPKLLFMNKTTMNGGYLYNGIDRLDNNKGYTEENCVSCCKICNYMKLNTPYEEFIYHIRKISANLAGRPSPPQK